MPGVDPRRLAVRTWLEEHPVPTLLAGGDETPQQRWLPGILDGSEIRGR
jgi:hypothetical protein